MELSSFVGALGHYVSILTIGVLIVLALAFIWTLAPRTNLSRRVASAIPVGLLGILFIVSGIGDLLSPIRSTDAEDAPSKMVSLERQISLSEREITNLENEAAVRDETLKGLRARLVEMESIVRERDSLKQELVATQASIRQTRSNLDDAVKRNEEAANEVQFLSAQLDKAQAQLSQVEAQLNSTESPATEGITIVAGGIRIHPGYQSIVSVFPFEGDREKAKTYYATLLEDEQAAKIFPAGTAVAFEQLARLELSDGNVAQAQEYHDKALNLTLELGQPSARFVSAYDMLDLSWLLKQDLELAREYESYALKIAGELDFPWGIGESHLNSGILSYIDGKSEQAENQFRQALDVFTEHKYQIGMIMTLFNLRALAGEMGLVDKVKAYEADLQTRIDALVTSK